jgi:lysophospholipase L1-like esterase
MKKRFVIGGAGALLGFAGRAHAQDSVTGRPSISPFFEAAKSSRVDIVMLGDSNQVFLNTGWDHGWHKGLHERFGLYATGLMPCGENLGYTMGLGYGYQTFFTEPSGLFLYTGAPPALESLMQQGIGFNPQHYMRVSENVTVHPDINQGLILFPNQPIDVNSAIRFHAVYGTFAWDDPGSFRLAIRLQAPPYTQLATGPVIPTATGFEGASSAWVDLPAGPRNLPLNLRWAPSSAPELQPIDGPFIGYYTRAEMLTRLTGASAHTLYALGGQSARDAAHTLNLAPDEQLSLYFSKVRELQGASKHVMIRVCFGVNDLGEPLPSVGPKQITPGSLPEAFADNLQAIINRLMGIWTVNGWPEDELYFVFSVTPPMFQPDFAELVKYRDIAEQVSLVNARTALIRFDVLTSYDECQANKWYVNPGDPAHLSQAGFEALAQRELDALTRCPVDIDDSGALDIDDYIGFQTRFVLGLPAADMDDTGTIDINDFIAFQTLFVLGC